MTAGLESRSSAGGKLKHGLAWIVFVFVVPAIFAALLLGFALQILGVPVLKTVEHQLGLGKPVVTTAIGPTTADLLHQEQSKYQRLVIQRDSLQAQLSTSESRIQGLHHQISLLEKQVKAQAASTTAAKSEGQILVAMDASQAAQLLAKMPIDVAARVVAAMSSTDSGPVLAAMVPQTAAQIILKAGRISHS